MTENPKSLSETERGSLPLSLAAGASVLVAKRDSKRALLGFDQMSGGRISYHAALAFVYSLVNLLPLGRRVVTSKMADELYGRYMIPEGLSLEIWRRDFALACSVAFKRGHLKKIAKGIYEL